MLNKPHPRPNRGGVIMVALAIVAGLLLSYGLAYRLVYRSDYWNILLIKIFPENNRLEKGIRVAGAFFRPARRIEEAIARAQFVKSIGGTWRSSDPKYPAELEIRIEAGRMEIVRSNNFPLFAVGSYRIDTEFQRNIVNRLIIGLQTDNDLVIEEYASSSPSWWRFHRAPP